MEHVLIGGLEDHFPFQMGDLEVPAVDLPGCICFFPWRHLFKKDGLKDNHI